MKTIKNRKALILLVLLFAALIFNVPLLRFTGRVLVRNDSPVHRADAILVLAGDIYFRAKRAADLYKQKVAPLVYMIRPENSELIESDLIPTETAIAKKLMIQNGVPSNAFKTFEQFRVGSTVEEAKAYQQVFQEMPQPKRIVIVTSWSHTSRAKWVFGRVFRDSNIQFQMVAAEQRRASPDDWWKSHAGILSVVQEYLKWPYYLIHYSF